MFKYAVVFAALLAVAMAADIPFEACEGWPMPLNVFVPECESVPCNFSVGQEITVNFDFETPHTVNKLPTLVNIAFGGESVTFPLPTGDACSAVVGGCPVEAGTGTVVFPLSLNGLPADQETVITVAITDENGYAIACGSVNTSFTQ